MAMKLNAENVAAGDASAARKSNRAQAIRDACRDIANLEAERDGVSEQIREIRQKIVKGELGMKLADFGMAYRLYKLEDDDRDELFGTIRECFSALGVGEQLDFLKAVDKAAAPGAGPVDADGFSTAAQQQVAEAEAYNLGEKAARDGTGLESCPYTAAQKRLKARFEEGWSDAKAGSDKVTPIGEAKRGRGRPKGSGKGAVMTVVSETLGPNIEEDFLPDAPTAGFDDLPTEPPESDDSPQPEMADTEY
jgi:hypothetical protein